jgi:hypothetical protein
VEDAAQECVVRQEITNEIEERPGENDERRNEEKVDGNVENALAGEFPEKAGVAADVKIGEPAVIEIDRFAEDARFMGFDPVAD